MSKTTTVAEESTRPDPDAADARPVDDGPTAEADDTADWRTEADDRLTDVESASRQRRRPRLSARRRRVGGP